MATRSSKNIAEALYMATKGKSGHELEQAIKRGAKVLKDRRMLSKSIEILNALQNIIEKNTGAVRVKVTTAKKIEVGERKKIENEIKEKYKAETVISEFFERAELLGGMRVEVGDEVIDSTYKNKLQRLEKFLIKKV
jgi:F0F1-type ATP synthase delta subunit